MKKKFNLFILTFCMLWFSGICFSETKEFVIGVEDLEYFPHYTHDGEYYKGYAREFFDNFAKQKGYVIQFKILPVKRLFKEFLDGIIDFKYPDNPYWQQDLKKGKTIHYTNSVAEYIDGIMVLTENKGAGLDKLKILGTMRGFTAWDYLDLINSEKIKLNENNTFTGLLQQIILKRIDGAYVNVAVAKYQLNEFLKRPGSLVFDANLPHTKGSYLCSSIKYPEIIQEINNFLTENKTFIDELKKKYQIDVIE
ncbi:MAG: transporter substrate-binding domain-containing protein [Desulfobacterales bacterium]|nr:transporter substrate-binding domain-containing protein [Desulfobacterales bacterium]